MKTSTKTILAVGLLAVASGCSSTDDNKVQVPPKPELPDQLELPPNYGRESNMRDLVLVCSFHNDIDGETGLADLAPDLSTEMQGELGRINRFKVYSLWSDQTYRLAKDLMAVGEVEVQSPPPTIDLFLNGVVTATTAKATKKNGNDVYVYQVQATVELQDSDRFQVWSRNFVGGKVYRTAILNTQGGVTGGFDPRRKEDVHKALDESARVLLHDLVTELGHDYPVTGRVTGVVDDLVGIDRGTQHGIQAGMAFTVWARRSGVDIPLIHGHVQPGGARSTIKVAAKDESNATAQAILASMRSDPDWIERNPNSLYATSWGLGIPPDWSQRSVIEAKYREYER